MAAFLERIAGARAVVSGNSSGGLVALWLAANRPELISRIVLEDAPVFSAEMPRCREKTVSCTRGSGAPSRRSGTRKTGTWTTTSVARYYPERTGVCGASRAGSRTRCRGSSAVTKRITPGVPSACGGSP